MKDIVEKKFQMFLSHPLIAQARSRLAADLPQGLKYHSAEHTDDVMREVILFGLTDNLAAEEIELLVIGAAFHDLGYISGPLNHEARGAEIARSEMKNAGMDKPSIEAVAAMILDTKLTDAGSKVSQNPSSELSKYLLDADLGNLGREDFFTKLEDTIVESGIERGLVLRQALALMEGHAWLTPAARKLRQQGKEKNEAKLRRLVAGG